MLFGSSPDMGVDMKHMKSKNLIRLVAALALAVPVIQVSPVVNGESVTVHAPATTGGIHVPAPDAVVGGQAISPPLCVGLVLLAPFFPLAIVPAVPVCYHAYTSTFG